MSLNWSKQSKLHSAESKPPERQCPKCDLLRPESPRWPPGKPCSICVSKSKK